MSGGAIAEPVVLLPPAFAAFGARSDAWRTWLERLPRLVRDVMAEWSLSDDGPPTTGEAAIVIPVRTADGAPAVLKVGFPHTEAEQEHLALRLWEGRAAVRLLRADPRRFCLLLERVHHNDLTSLPVLPACEVVASAYARLHVPATPAFRSLTELAGRWSDGLGRLPARGPVPRRYVEQAASLAASFATDPATDGRIVHTDLHYGNVLAADREPWLVIDPKPLSGDPHHEVAPLLWNRWDEIVHTGDVRGAVRARFHTVVDTAMLDEDRARDWVVVRVVVNVLWRLEALQQPGAQRWGAADDDLATRWLAIAKAVQQ
ncbi:MAG: weak similarity to aminoglycoside phosphotransferase [uncultured Nocardioidaceae bacterium]|uniref:Weak similarity to aminoglycoside phosphotransferase n=1 Tax=uncultured Nocardioidaceae bacterium TaxID=253824 RepID=A0A6J4MX36_9ACTN|nr:MAG: weak similarity to aminoglycoside phosphotransferase [uncultured Nocardioidaceae bacterium]